MATVSPPEEKSKSGPLPDGNEQPPAYAPPSYAVMNPPPPYGYIGGTIAVQPSHGVVQYGPTVPVVQQGVTVYPEGYTDVPDYTWLSIISLFCCLPIAIFSILQSTSAKTLKMTGQYQLAQEKARTAKYSALLSIGLGLLIIVVDIIVLGVLIG